MAKKAKKDALKTAYPEFVPEPTYQDITDTLEKNYMPYVMTVIVSRAIPEIDGLKPSQRKLLYTMYKMGLLSGGTTKSTNVVGQTMKLNPHGDASIYDTLVRLTRGHEALLHPLVESKGTFGKHYSRSMQCAASRYTEVKLAGICKELFYGIDRDAVDFTDSYDNTTTEPVLLPVTYPNILVSPNLGIAVGMASNICSFNLSEICDATIQILKNPETSVERLLDIVQGPDFSTGGYYIYDRKELRTIFETGRGKLTLRAKWKYDPAYNCIEIYEVPYSSSIETILTGLATLMKADKLREVSDVRDETDLNGLKLTIDLKKGVDPEKLMAKLFSKKSAIGLQNDFSCNFNVLIHSVPRQLGVAEIIKEWILFRLDCLRREQTFFLAKKEEKLQLLLGLGIIFLDLDKAIKIIRETEKDADVIPNLMAGFSGLTEVQAEYIANIKLRNLTREYIRRCLADIDDLQNEIAEIHALLASPLLMRKYIAKQLAEIKKTYGNPRRTELMDAADVTEFIDHAAKEEETMPVRLVVTRAGYLKKWPLKTKIKSYTQHLKEDDEIVISEDAGNADEMLFFTSKQQLYKCKLSEFNTALPGDIGTYVPSQLKFDKDEVVLFAHRVSEYRADDSFVFFFENGRGVRIPATAYETKNNRRKLVNAFSDISPLVAVHYERGETDYMLLSDEGRALVVKSPLIPQMSTKRSQGVQLFRLGKGKVTRVLTEGQFSNTSRYRKLTLPSIGVVIRTEDMTPKTIVEE